jgi:hypothetical protein
MPIPPALGTARSFKPGRHQIWLRCSCLRCLHSTHRWRRGAFVLIPGSAVAPAKVTTIEGLSATGNHPVQLPGPKWMCRNAAIASRARLWQRQLY